MTETPPDWVIRREAELCGVTWLDDLDYDAQRKRYHADSTTRALCDMIQKHEQPPVDRKLLCAREAWARQQDSREYHLSAEGIRSGRDDNWDGVKICAAAIELYESGFGK